MKEATQQELEELKLIGVIEPLAHNDGSYNPFEVLEFEEAVRRLRCSKHGWVQETPFHAVQYAAEYEPEMLDAAFQWAIEEGRNLE